MSEADSNRPTGVGAANQQGAPALAPHFPAPAVGPRPTELFDVAPARTPIPQMRHEPEQANYLAAAGTLMQFNALVATLLAAALAMTASATLRIAIVLALIVHTVAALLLCWAVRPIGGGDAAARRRSSEGLAADTFHNYRRGWRATMFAICLTTGVLCLITADVVGIRGIEAILK